MNQEDYYKVLLQHLIKVIASMRGQVIEEVSLQFAEAVAIKLMGHFSSLGLLYQGTKLQFRPTQFLDFIDHGSITVLTRAALETGLAFNFIFCEPKNQQEREFRFICWDYAGYWDRQAFLTISEKGRQLKRQEAMDLERIRQQITAHAYFARHNKEQQNLILKGRWSLGHSWTSIAANTGYSKDYVKSIYSYLCGFAHTSRLSVTQILQAKSKEDQKTLSSTCIGYGCVIMANFLWGYSTLFNVADVAFKSDEGAYNIAKMWREIGQEMGKDSDLPEKEN